MSEPYYPEGWPGDHPQVDVVYNGVTIHVDERMAPLLKLMWVHGIDTCFSCQGGPGKCNSRAAKKQTGYIMFRDDESFERFKAIVEPSKHYLCYYEPHWQVARWHFHYFDEICTRVSQALS